MLHECNLNCHTMDLSKLSDLGIDDDGKWMPFMFDMDIVEACKLTSDDEDLLTYDCTTIFTRGGDAYIIDTPYRTFFNILKEYHSSTTDENENDLEL